jgi:hypothetical protein
VILEWVVTLSTALWSSAPAQPVVDPLVFDPPAPLQPDTSPAFLELGNDAEPIDRNLLPNHEQRRKIGTNTTIYVNFDGVTLDHCEPSNSKLNCSSLNAGVEFPPWSGTWANRVAILDSMRARTSDFGIRITGVRPPDTEDYVMIVYGDSEDAEEDEAVLGRAPSGDCYDALPNQIAFAYLDGERATWVKGGAATALHEAGHTWGLDHIDANHAIMAPAGDNSNAYFTQECFQIVESVDLDPGGESCPDINLEYCGVADLQDDRAILQYLFGAPYVDDEPPVLELISPEDGSYIQGPTDFEVVLEIHDDLHPQYYARTVTLVESGAENVQEGLTDINFPMVGLPLGHHTIQVRVRDQAGNESMLEFEIDIGEDPPPVAAGEEGCACGVGERGSPPSPWLLLLLVPLAPRVPMVARRRRKR